MQEIIEQLISQRKTLIVEICDSIKGEESSLDKLTVLQQEIAHIDEFILKIYDRADLVDGETTEV